MPDVYAERWKNSVQSHTAMMKQFWGSWMVVGNVERGKEGERDIVAGVTHFFVQGLVTTVSRWPNS
jgi:hypothetical protein